MEKLDGVFLLLQKNFDKGIKHTNTIDAIDKFKDVLKEMIEVLDGIREDHLEPRIEDTEDFYTVKEASMKYRISTITLYKLIKARKIPVIIFGNKIRIPKNAIEVYQNSSKFDL